MAQARAGLVTAPRRVLRVDTTRVGVVVGVAALTGLLYRLVLLARPLRVVDRLFVPDDTYYTLSVARSLAHGHGPTTDGHTLTSGFQPLLAFVMTPVYWIMSNADRGLRADLLLLILADTTTILVLAWIAYRIAGACGAIVAAAIWAVSPVATSMALGGLETSLAMVCDAALVALWIRMNDEPGTGRAIACGAVAGLAVLARIDALLLVALLVVVQLVRGSRRVLGPVAVAGGVVLAPWWGWCLATFGSPIPASGRAVHSRLDVESFTTTAFAKAAGAVSGGAFGTWNWLRERFVRHPAIGTIAFVVFVVVLLAAAFLLFRVRGSADDRRDGARAVAATLTAFAAGLLVFYAWFGVWWYDTRYLAPVALVTTLLVAVGTNAVWERRASLPRPAWLVTAGLLVVPVALALRTDVHRARSSGARAPGLDAATGYREVAARVVAILPRGSRVGAWQSGALGYYGADRLRVVNLDGVVNPDASRAFRNHDTATYARRVGVTWLADWQAELLLFVAQARHPRPTLVPVTVVPQPAGYPYDVVTVRWPPSAPRGRPDGPSGTLDR